MRLTYLFLLFLGLLLTAACSCLPAAPPVVEHDFGPLFRAQGLEGSLLLYEEAAGRFVAYNAARCRQGFLPASTFKIPNTLIALQTGALRDTADICPWDGTVRSIAAWNQDMPFARALRVSAVPCYQQLARRMGVAAYQQWLPKLGYPGMVVMAATLDTFWLGGDSRISQFAQIDFLRRLQAETLPIEKRHQQALKQLLILKKTPAYTLYGKTGWRFRTARNPDNGWLVGWLAQADGRRVFFALNAEPAAGQPADARFGPARQLIVEAALTEVVR
ncbi:class D beta-lactamase [Hymenobacter lapidiphilus]|uniref:class D beta-lactamase n=1 Tax=Hymenobacter sp. CCM 8763 TaxID=2303334 RepID=UPI000E346C73|nr:class D beta-lactamase [Hymenobacter sp. CCM 8763]RFP65221.1 class D beta-lactamase [Hymenobacter sp. CCM 8763]